MEYDQDVYYMHQMEAELRELGGFEGFEFEEEDDVQECDEM